MDDRSRAQAAELARALQDQLRKMLARLAWLESRDVTTHNGRASEMRRDAATLHTDIREAYEHLSQLQRRYLGSPSDIDASARGADQRGGPGRSDQVRHNSGPAVGSGATLRSGALY